MVGIVSGRKAIVAKGVTARQEGGIAEGAEAEGAAEGLAEVFEFRVYR